MADDGHTINVGPVTIGEPLAEPPAADRIIKWCATHDDVAVVYGDGSVSCRWDLVVETSTNDHVLTDLPEISRLRDENEALRAEQERLRAMVRYWRGDDR